MSGVGAAKAAEIAKQAYREGRPIVDVAVERTDLPREQLERLLDPARERSPRVLAMAEAVTDGAAVYERLAPLTLPVGRVDFFADLPEKHVGEQPAHEDASRAMRDLVDSSRDELVMQTPYLVLSRPARKLFREMHARPDPPEVIVSTNSLAATDAFILGMAQYTGIFGKAGFVVSRAENQLYDRRHRGAVLHRKSGLVEQGSILGGEQGRIDPAPGGPLPLGALLLDLALELGPFRMEQPYQPLLRLAHAAGAPQPLQPVEPAGRGGGLVLILSVAGRIESRSGTQLLQRGALGPLP